MKRVEYKKEPLLMETGECRWKSRIHRRTATCIVIMIAIFLILLGSSIRAFASPGIAGSECKMHKYHTSIRVEKGDTLWKIADSYVSSEMTKKEFIKEVCRLNHMDENDILRSGDYIVIVYYAEHGNL